MERPPRRKALVLPLWFGLFTVCFTVAMLLVLPFAIVLGSEWTAYVAGVLFSIGFSVLASRRWRQTIVSSDANGYTLRVERKQSSPGGSGSV
jgi:hypothetical protein